MSRIYVLAVLSVLVFGALSQAQTFTTLFNFTGTSDGANPYGALVQGSNGNLYGTTSSQFGAGYGTVFEITADGTLTTLYTFCSLPSCADGSYPVSGLILASNGNFYGVTNAGGAHSYGTIFELTPQGTLSTLYSFCSEPNCVDGVYPAAGLLQGMDGNFYGATAYGGGSGYGTLFKITNSGILTTLYSFCSQTNCADGSIPFGSLIQVKNGSFYGTTAAGGAYGNYLYGTVYKLTPQGKLTTIYSFCSLQNCADGNSPTSGLLLGRNGKLYGTTTWGGPFPNLCNNGTGCGTVFEISALGKLTTLYNFCSKANCADGNLPLSSLIQASNGELFGTAPYGGRNGRGTIFELTMQGKLAALHSFAIREGSDPVSALLQAADGSLYGTTLGGGFFGWGTVFRISKN